jgi:phosphoribosylamine--glycine ligase
LKVLVVGHGAREHAIVKKLMEEDVEIFAAMSRRNPGIAKAATRVEIFDLTRLESYDRFDEVDIAFIGPEAPLAAGVADHLLSLEIPVVGPTRELARLEWSKAYTRSFLMQNGIEGNPEFSICRNLKDVKRFLAKYKEVAVKPDVLTGGKGVRITSEHLNSTSEVEAYAAERISSDGLVVLEEKLSGREFTLQTFTDGNRVEVMPLVRDYKRAYDGDRGPNTGSMGSFSCPDHSLPNLPDSAVRVGEAIMKKTVKKMTDTKGRFKGVLYGGFMKTDTEVYLLEYNVRFGDPEAINVLALLETPLLDVGWEIIDGRLAKPVFQREATVCVYLVPKGYPTSPKKGVPINIKKPQSSELYYASVHEEENIVYTTTSRSLALLGKGRTIREAREKAYKDVPEIIGDLFFRKDIAANL